MIIVRCLVLSLLFACFNGNIVSAADSSASLASHYVFTPELKSSTDSFLLAKSTFLPDTYDDLGLSGRHNTKYDFNRNDCSAYPLPKCPSGAKCDKCPVGAGYRLNSCTAPHILSGGTCKCPATVSLGTNDKCTKYCDNACIEKSCTPYANERDCSKGYQDCDNGCGGTRKCCVPCVDLVSSCGANQTFNYSTCIDGNGQLNIKTGCSCKDGYHMSGSSCVKDCNITNCAGFTLSSCPANGNCSTCTKTAANCSTDGTKYKLDSCKDGYSKSGDSCVKAPQTCQEYISQNKIYGITFNSFTTEYLSGTYRGPKSVNYSKCQEMATPVITVTKPLNYAYLDIDGVDLVFNLPSQIADEECEEALEYCKTNASNDSERLRNCMSGYIGSVSDYCSFYNLEECCPKKYVAQAVEASNVTLKNTTVTSSYRLSTGNTKGKISLQGNTNIKGTLSTYASTDGQGGATNGGTITVESGDNTIDKVDAYKSRFEIKNGAIARINYLSNYQNNQNNWDGNLSTHVFGKLYVTTMNFTNGPVTVHNGGYASFTKLSASNAYKGRIIYEAGAEIKIGSVCKRPTSAGSKDYASDTTSNTISGGTCTQN